MTLFVQDLILFGTKAPSFLCYIQVFYSHFYRNTLLLDLKSDIPPLMHFHLVISPLRFQIVYQPQTRNPDYRRQHHTGCVKVKCLEISRFFSIHITTGDDSCATRVKQFISSQEIYDN